MRKQIVILIAFFMLITAVAMIGCRERVAVPPGAEPTATPTATATPFGYSFSFEPNLEGWTLGGDPAFTGLARTPKASVPGGTVPAGNYCAAVSCAYTASNISGEMVWNPALPDFSTGNSITAKVYLPSDLPAGYSVNVFILSGSGYVFTGNNVTTYTLGAWNTFPLDYSAVPTKNDVRTVAVQVNKNGGSNWSGTIYIDDIQIY